MAVEAFAPAKINLTLHVTGQRADGYHLLDSLVGFCDLGDVIRVRPADDLSLKVTGPRAAGVPTDGTNLVLRAAELIRPAGQGAEITLEKHLPAAAGIGGGSSDAAAALRALAQLWRVELPGQEALLSLGADVPVCMTPGAWRMQGIGEELTRLPALPPCEILLVNPGVSVATPSVFRGLTSRQNDPMPQVLPRWRDAAELAGWLSMQRNDLQAPAISAQPVIATVLQALQASKALFSAMSGSGATCFALYDAESGQAGRAAEAIRAAYPDWWVMSGLVLSQ
ncbi:4-(cytidine 5'-diphospho)-2-C-methyl-D-erythritol kinase [Phaeobacter sp. QD34_3]|uniref:4-(cytidine 5'-diphospho)-2-C-methyl-D-erythritol kinase n=1 Tax=unclassified Phaeobacter TaxID=2621772 RepID=UPI00237EEDCC|nr:MULTISPECIES: 4-(cytidine 5'-diphospho)-2-C-methyl-D-erythritol kinase [unclassified Phaeobacter]MDE4134283.1 4-(cytidine 5'-diphospho)-2-C-methyl-D-erythritol kinase [Phaeobacter sp. QD34_3]MDE4138025.1 4-(cytidine 5'-diphospho)-2-C-methyl-D-erythritol kinase [Phaeobacter sp. QD34_24]